MILGMIFYDCFNETFMFFHDFFYDWLKMRDFLSF